MGCYVIVIRIVNYFSRSTGTEYSGSFDAVLEFVLQNISKVVLNVALKVGPLVLLDAV